MADQVDSLPKPETPKETRERVISESRDAIQRLNEITADNFFKQSQSEQNLLDYTLATIYNHPLENIRDLPVTSKQRLLYEEIGRDIMYRELFEDDGSLSDFHERLYPNIEIDPNEYQLIGTSWEAAQ